MEFPEVITLNNLSYCEEHLRDVCYVCCVDFHGGPFIFEFELPENGKPEYPVSFRYDNREDTLLAKRWLDMQRVTYSAHVSPMTSSHVQLPKLGLAVEANNSREGLRETLLGMFHQLLPMCTTQRYFFANQPSIMLQDLETFEQAMFLYEANLLDILNRNFNFPSRSFYDVATEFKKKARASYVSSLGFFLELNTQRTFWQTMELTTEAYIRLLESYDQEADDHVLLTEKAKAELMLWIGQVFWSFRHAQHVLNEFRKQQHMMYQRNNYPFYPCDLEALEDGLDVHLIVAKLSRGPAHDFGFMASAFDAFRQASDDYPEQMEDVNYAIMVAIDEMSARFRILEILTSAGQVISTCEEVKTAILRFEFDSTGIELFSAMEDALTIITEVDDASEYQTPTPKDCSFLQELLALERKCRIKHRQKFASLPEQATLAFTKEMFDSFKSTYKKLYRESIRALWKEREKSLLSVNIASRVAHRLLVQNKKKKKKKPSASGSSAWEIGDIAEARSVPEQSAVDPELFWNRGAQVPLERYKPPIVQEKTKTQKASIAPSPDASVSSASRTPSPVEEVPSPRLRSLDQLKESDLATRDILWRKAKGLVKWSNIVQFLARLGCKILSLDGSKKKVVDEHTGRCTVLHRPHPGDDCRRDQLDRYRLQLEDWLLINYEDIVTLEEKNSESGTSISTSPDSSKM
ncbi:hypothetical protein M758_1G017900 [Ceratodon purpureus]|nr:hypothetical protein M758_1G017900 [Ceratodon purpureus]KAG0628317.1 hypothetical protein M758_1G017900 [Ceratodon purpureus]KAG0628318.1 hypothetical protein M758_1G017900 [Ceratodon purpureus]KAG0628319.1 hypothetical protein M758_1G017900 [Ceratodon purpureus]KAG0628320.1 hypothetical protein M758_1G017900 [Ceratodon purpureus]